MSGYKTYIITFMAPNVNLAAFHQYLNDSVEILAYWNYIPLVYCVKSRLDATSLRDRLRPFLPESMFVAEIDRTNMNGYMANTAVWDWFWADAPERKPSLPANLLSFYASLALPKP
jgi:hypothetical protein